MLFLLLDADALIKLYHAGVLELIAEVVWCLVPLPVYQEVVVQGNQRGSPDAASIDALIQGYMYLVDPEPTAVVLPSGLGDGERSLFSLVRGSFPYAQVVSDDRVFLSWLGRQGIPAVTPARLLVHLYQRKILTREQARDALELIKELIRPAYYEAARQDLDLAGE